MTTAAAKNSLLWFSPLLIALVGFLAMYLPVYWWALNTIWNTDEHFHGVLILAVVVWLFWEQRNAMLNAKPEPVAAVGWPCFIFGLLTYVAGTVFNISILQFGSQIPVLAGVILLIVGWSGLRIVWFPLLYLIFMVPLPGMLIDTVTGPLKQWISFIAESVLYAAGYPIARNGVTLSIGQYQMLVADACSGIRSMFSLFALGTLFLYIKARTSVFHNTIVFVSILPIAFAANLVRVMVLVLITYHLGDEAGQGFLHGASGIVLIVAALLLLLLIDAVLARFIRPLHPALRS